MSAAKILEELRRMPENERREIVQQILDEFTEFDDELMLEEIARILQRCARRYEEKIPDAGIPAKKFLPKLKNGSLRGGKTLLARINQRSKLPP